MAHMAVSLGSKFCLRRGVVAEFFELNDDAETSWHEEVPQEIYDKANQTAQ